VTQEVATQLKATAVPTPEDNAKVQRRAALPKCHGKCQMKQLQTRRAEFETAVKCKADGSSPMQKGLCSCANGAYSQMESIREKNAMTIFDVLWEMSVTLYNIGCPSVGRATTAQCCSRNADNSEALSACIHGSKAGTLEEGTVPPGFRPGPGNKPVPKCAAWFAKLKGTKRVGNFDPRVPVLGEGFFGRRRRRKKVPAETSMEKATRRRRFSTFRRGVSYSEGAKEGAKEVVKNTGEAIKTKAMDWVLTKLPSYLQPAGRAWLEQFLVKPSPSNFYKTTQSICAYGSEHWVNIQRFFGQISRAVQLKLFKWNPCMLECQCRSTFEPVLSPEYTTNAVPANFAAHNDTLRAELIKKAAKLGLPVDGTIDNIHSKLGQLNWLLSRYSAINLAGYNFQMAAEVMKQFVGSKEDFIWLYHLPKKFLIQKRKNDGRALLFSQKPLVCEMSVSYFVGECSTCCCRSGLLAVMIDTELTKMPQGKTKDSQKEARDCKVWFTVLDTILRAILNVVKGVHGAKVFAGHNCFD